MQAGAHGVSTADVVLRWLRQRGIVAIPKSPQPPSFFTFQPLAHVLGVVVGVTPARIESNLQGGVGWSLSDEDMAAIAAIEGPGRAPAADSIL